MADNIDVTPGTGKTIAADEITSVLHQRVKVEWGPDGTANEADTATGKPLPIQVRSATGLIPIGEPTDAAAAQTDTTSVSLISLVKQLSSYLGTLAGAVGSSKVATKAAAADFADGAIATLGLKADAKSTATDTTSITIMQVVKQISASIQAAAASVAGTLTVSNTPLTNFGAGEYETVAASQTAQVLGATGGTGDFISGILVVPATTSPGNVLLLDNATSITVFTGGTTSVSNLVPFFIPLGMISVSGAWKITTGTNVSCIGIGNFT